jgi:response regulator RpfG family c-di-GMP phosphodiesterase
LGKVGTPVEVLRKTSVWSDDDYELMKQHVLPGYEMIKARFSFTAEVILLHHKFQENGYPKDLPPHLQNYSEETRMQIVRFARIVALADVFDALHRENSKFRDKGSLSEAEVKEKMFELNPDVRELVESLYEVGIFG